MSSFWENNNIDNIALIDDSGKSYSYGDLQSRIDIIKEKLNKQSERQLICLEVRPHIACIASYLACLQAKQPILLLNADLSDDLKQGLLRNYHPNIVIRFDDSGSLVIDTYSDKVHQLHSELAVLLSTSGTTGDPKLVKLSFANLQSNAGAIANYLKITSSDRAISSLPIFYSYGLSILNSHLFARASYVVTNHTLMQKEFWQTFKENNVTSLSGVPYVYEILRRLRFSRMELPSLRYMTQAGGKLNSKHVAEFAQLAKDKEFDFYVMYGQTEATARISYLDPKKALTKSGSIGQSIPNGKLTLKNETGQTITTPNTEGELVYQGLNVMLGYAYHAEDLATADNTDTLSTGDIAYFDEEGDFFIVGRTKRFIKLFGLRINLDQIEDVTNKNGFTCFCGGSDDLLRVAVEAGKEESLNDVIKFISDEFKIHINSIKGHVITGEVPLTANGKINYKVIFENE